ncbi:MAG: MFS transporter [Crenarchaeota archaeon]|nr:MFS transporter [Thermoproteota archaeon]
MEDKAGNNEKTCFNRRNVYALSLTSLLTDISSESVYAVLPFYILSLGYGRDIVGFVEGLGGFLDSLMRLASGHLSDRIRRYKLLASIGYFISSISKPFFALARSWPLIALIRVLDRVGKGIRTSPRDALLSFSTSPDYRGKAFGLHRSLDTMGAIIGPLLAFLILPVLGYSGVFIFSIVPGLLAVLTIAVVVSEKKLCVKITSYKEKKMTRSIPLSKMYWLFLLSVGMSGLTGFGQAFLLVRSVELGWSKEYSLVFLMISNIVYASIAYPVGIISDRMGDKRHYLYPVVFIITFITGVVLTVSSSPVAAIVSFVLLGVYMAFNDTLRRIITGLLLPVESRGAGYGYMHGVYGFAYLTGNIVLGRLYQLYGAGIGFTYMSFMALIGFMAALLFTASYKRSILNRI